MPIKTVFFNVFGRLRSGWRFVIFLALFLALTSILAVAVQLIFGGGRAKYSEESALFLVVNSLIALVSALFTGWLCGKFLEGLPFRALGAWFTTNWFKHLALGIITGSVSICFAVSIAIVFGGLSFEINPNQGQTAILNTLGSSFVIFAVAAAFEEALFRGYILQTFSRAGLPWLAVILTSAFFGVVHVGNPNAGIVSTLNTILAGIWFSVAYLKTRDLWFVWGMHLMWNWVQGAFFGIEVSGLTDITTASFLTERDRGPTWLTGEDYGIEGGIACTIALLVSTAVIYFMTIILKPSEEILELTSSEAETRL